MPDVGTGTSAAFATSSFTGSIMGITRSGVERPSIPTSHLGTTDDHTFMPGDLVDQGSYDFALQFDPDTTPPIDGAAEVITITFPLPSGQSTPATAVFTGFVVSRGEEVPLEDLMTASFTVKVTGNVVITASA